MCEQPESRKGLLGPWPLCSQKDFDDTRDIKIKETVATFAPLLEQVKNLTSPFNSSGMLAWIQDDPQPPKNRSTINVTSFCDKICQAVHTAIEENVKDDPEGAYAKLHCPETCSKAFEGAQKIQGAEVDTRCSCKATVCPALLDTLMTMLHGQA